MSHWVAYSYISGHLAESVNGGDWFYDDTNESISIKRSCVRCRQYAINDEYDACMGEIPAVRFACCGHGAEDGYIVLNSGYKFTIPVGWAKWFQLMEANYDQIRSNGT